MLSQSPSIKQPIIQYSFNQKRGFVLLVNNYRFKNRNQGENSDLVSLNDVPVEVDSLPVPAAALAVLAPPPDLETEHLISQIEQLTSRALEETNQWNSAENSPPQSLANANSTSNQSRFRREADENVMNARSRQGDAESAENNNMCMNVINENLQ